MTEEEKEELKKLVSDCIREEENAMLIRLSQRAKEGIGSFVLSKIYVIALAVASWAYFSLTTK